MLFYPTRAFGAIARDDHRRRLVGLRLTQTRIVDVRVFRIEAELPCSIDADVDVIRGVEPAAPEPVEIDAGCLFHRAEEVRRGEAA